jgi:hypothetical protein
MTSTPVHVRKWWDVANDRRQRLIVKKHQGGGLTEAQENEYKMLQAIADLMISTYAASPRFHEPQEGKIAKVVEEWKPKLREKILTMDVWEAMEELRIHGITLSLGSVAPFDPMANYCEPFNHEEKYRAQIWGKEYQKYGKAFYGMTPAEAFRKAALSVLGGTREQIVGEDRSVS